MRSTSTTCLSVVRSGNRASWFCSPQERPELLTHHVLATFHKISMSVVFEDAQTMAWYQSSLVYAWGGGIHRENEVLVFLQEVALSRGTLDSGADFGI